MARIAGINIPMNKHVWVGLTSIYGVGRTQALKACEGAGVTARVRLLPAGGSPRSHSMFCQRGKVSATHTARGARPPPRRGS